MPRAAQLLPAARRPILQPRQGALEHLSRAGEASHRVARSARWGGHAPLQVVIGPVHAEPAVVSGVVVVRPLATITVEANAGADVLLRFVAVLAEQLGQV